jgi:antitoxin (DNA-binding transcriptional repressor) of toxin-antitoxin stability system
MERIVGIRELKQNASAVVAMNKAGDTVTITEHGNKVSMMIPYPEDDLLRLELQGRLIRPKVRFDPSLLKPVEVDGPSIQELLDESREERL